MKFSIFYRTKKAVISLAMLVVMLTQSTAYAETASLALSNFNISNITTSSAKISWDSNLPADSQITYGLITSYYGMIMADTTLVTAHGLTLQNLQAQTFYHYKISSKDSAGNTVMTEDKTFTTGGPDASPPIISNLVISNIQSSSANIGWDTNEATSSELKYGLSSNYNNIKTSDNLYTGHQFSLDNLMSNATYHFQITAKDLSGNSQTIPDQIFTTNSVTEPANNFTMSGTLRTNSVDDMTVEVKTASHEITNTIGDTLGLSFGNDSSTTQNRHEITPDDLIPGSKIKIAGFLEDGVYFADQTSSSHFNLLVTGPIQSINTDTSEVIIKVESASPSLADFIGQNLTIKADENTFIRVGQANIELTNLSPGYDLMVFGNFTFDSSVLATRLIYLYHN